MHTLTPTAGRLEGERRRDDGIALAAERRQRLIWRCQLALLDAIRSRQDRTASTDDATSDVWREYADGGRWRGEVPKGLARLHLIRKVGVTESTRPSRHAGIVRLWQGVDDAAIDAHRHHLRRLLTATPAVEQPEQPTLFDRPQNNEPGA